MPAIANLLPPRVCGYCHHERTIFDFAPGRAKCRWCRAGERRAATRRRKPGSGAYQRSERHRALIAIGARLRAGWDVDSAGAWVKSCKLCFRRLPESEFRPHRGTCIACEGEI